MRTWTRTDFGRAIRWTSDDGRALVCVVPCTGGYRCEAYEDGAYVGSERPGESLSGEIRTARAWMKALGKPQ